ncbi:MAG: hypothetical protein IJN16_00595 [Lachnospiraceae bacterium]|nr:hypothetical protein [Lachnospiraceae bacterium]
MSEEMNQLEFKYLLLSQLSNYKELEKLLKNGNTEEALLKIEEYKSVISETLNNK